MLSVAVRISGMLLLSGVAEGQTISAGAVSGCYATVEEALSHAGEQQLAARPSTGYRVQATRWDPVLGRRWATVASCDHPERPTVLMASAAVAGDVAAPVRRAPTPNIQPVQSQPVQSQPVPSQPVQPSTRPAVSVGAAVQVFYQDDQMRMELAAIAEGNGNVGDTVRVKVTRYGPDGQGVEQHLNGIVRGPRMLQLLRPTGAFQP